MLEPSFLSKVSELTCADPEFERFLLRSRGSDAMFRVMTVYGVKFTVLYPWYWALVALYPLLVEAYMSFYLLNCIDHVWQVIWVSVKMI